MHSYLVEYIGNRSRITHGSRMSSNQLPPFARKGEWVYGFEVLNVMWDVRSPNATSIKVYIDD